MLLFFRVFASAPKAAPAAALAAIAAALACGAVSCAREETSRGAGTAESRSEQAAEPGRVTFLHYFSGSLRGGIDEVAASFAEAVPGGSLAAVALDHEAFKSSFLSDLAEGNPADLYSYWAGAKTRAVLADLSPLDALWEREGLSSRFTESLAAAACRYNGSYYLVPLTQHLVGFFYNVKAFRAAGIGIPTDWPSFKAACAALKAAGTTPIALGARDKWPAQFWFDYLLLRTAGPGYRERLVAGTASWTDPETVRVFREWKDLIDSGWFSASPNALSWDEDAGGAVASGRAAMILMGTWMVGAWKETAPFFREGDGYAFFPFPAMDPDVPRCAVGPVDGVVVPRRAPNPRGAEAAAAHLASAAAQLAMSRGSGALSPSLQVGASSYGNLHRAALEEISRADSWAFNYDLAAPPSLSPIGLDLFAEFLEYPGSYFRLLERAEARTSAARAILRPSGPSGEGSR